MLSPENHPISQMFQFEIKLRWMTEVTAKIEAYVLINVEYQYQ